MYRGMLIALTAGLFCCGVSGVAQASTFYIAANGSDANNGTSKTTPWQHAPGMPNCTGACAAHTPVAGDQFIFRGGDTWHFGNSSATPYTGGTWSWSWSGSSTNCDSSDNPSAVRTSCIYIGVDKTWFSGGSWSRPILTGDNPTSTGAVASCVYPNVGAQNRFLSVHNNAFAWFDNFEWTGMCQQTASSSSNGYLFDWNLYIVDLGGSAAIVQNIYSNMYAHGWTHLAYACSDVGGEPVGQCDSEGFISGGYMTTLGPGNVCDGWDSDPRGVTCIAYGPGYLVYDNVFANMSQIVVNGYHSWHDNYWFNYYPTGDGIAHGNSFESNVDAPTKDSNGFYQPNVPFNVFYNNILGHNSSGTGGDVKLWFCPNSTAAEYQFNNIVYDQGSGNNWDFAQSGFNCTASNAGVHFFNNTVDLPSGTGISCPGNGTMTNNHIITESGTGFNSGTCTMSNNTVMTHATAVAQGYMAAGTGTSSSNGNVTCANDTTPCAPTSTSAATVGTGANLASYCNALLGSSDGITVRAGQACQNGTSDGCTYNTATHSVTCPREALTVRPTSVAWNTGAYQYNGQSASNPPPSACTATQGNWGSSLVTGWPSAAGSNTVSMTANISAVGDLVAFTAWCFPSSTYSGGCTPISLTMGNQTATRTTVAGQPDPGTSGTPGSGQGFIYYILSASAAGSQTVTFNIQETEQLQISYMEFKPSAGCTFWHDVDSLLGQGKNVGALITSPSLTPTQPGDVLFNFTWTSTHMVDPVGGPWVPSIWQPQLSNFLDQSVDLVTYSLNAPASTVANNVSTLHATDSWQALITSFGMSSSSQVSQVNPPTSLTAIVQ